MKKVSKKAIQHGYIGVSHNVTQRWEQHKDLAATGKGSKLHKEMNDVGYVINLVTDDNLSGYDGHVRCLIMYADLGMVEAYQLEKELIAKYDLVATGLNSKEGGSVPSGNDLISKEHFIYYAFALPKD